MSFQQYISQIIYLTIFNMKARYRKTLAGFFWVILNPIIMYTAQAYVFKYILNINVPDYSVFLLSGLLPWMFMSQSLDMCVPIIQSQGELIKSFSFSPFVLVVSQLLDNFINFLFSFIIIFIPAMFLSNISLTGLIFLPISILLLVLTTGVTVYLFSLLQIFYRDIKFVLQFFTNIMIFLTPIFYPVHRIPENVRWLVDFNPFFVVIKHIRICIYSFDINSYLIAISANIVMLVCISVITHYFIKRRYNEIYILL